jgi:hypothetical protein
MPAKWTDAVFAAIERYRPGDASAVGVATDRPRHFHQAVNGLYRPALPQESCRQSGARFLVRIFAASVL